MNNTPTEQHYRTGTPALDFNKFFQSTAPTLILLPDAPVYTIVHANDNFLKATRTTKEDVLGRGIFDAFPQNPSEKEVRFAEVLQNSLRIVLEEKVRDAVPTQRYDIPIRGTDEFETRYWEGAFAPIFDENGEVEYIVHTVVDITGAYELARSARIDHEVAEEKRKVLHKLFKEAPAGICVFEGPELVFRLVNPTYQSFFPGRELCDKPLLEALPELKGHPLVDGFKKVYQTGQTYEGRELLTKLRRRPDGPLEDSYWNFIAQARYNEEGKIDGILMFGFEVTELVLSRQRIQESEERLHLALENTYAGVFDTDLCTGKTVRSLRHAQIYGYKDNSEEWTVEKMLTHIFPEDYEMAQEAYKHSLQTGSLNSEYRIRRLDGALRCLNVIGKVYYDSGGNPIRIVGTAADITDKKALQRQKDEFISTVSHELKTPVTSIKAYTQILQKALTGAENAKNQNFLLRMGVQVSRLENLIGGLLDVTRIESGKLLLNCSIVDMNLLLSELIIDLQLITPSHKLIVKENTPVRVYADKQRLEQVITNIITNAVKYSPTADKVHISLSGQGQKCVCSVQDFGPGIPDDQKPFVFERFHQVNKTDMNLGLGLGLYISSQIISLLGGKIWFESTLGEGTIFHFSLPSQQA